MRELQRETQEKQQPNPELGLAHQRTQTNNSSAKWNNHLNNTATMIESGWNKKRISKVTKRQPLSPRPCVRDRVKTWNFLPNTGAPLLPHWTFLFSNFFHFFCSIQAHSWRLLFLIPSFLQYRVHVIYDFSQLFQCNQLKLITIVMECNQLSRPLSS